uniref:Uncharacterized protein n=1 Tax=Cacopsylla melanoneura TaxID=428564 RepID=A0A8D9BV24_9HEMI
MQVPENIYVSNHLDRTKITSKNNFSVYKGNIPWGARYLIKPHEEIVTKHALSIQGFIVTYNIMCQNLHVSSITYTLFSFLVTVLMCNYMYFTHLESVPLSNQPELIPNKYLNITKKLVLNP